MKVPTFMNVRYPVSIKILTHVMQGCKSRKLGHKIGQAEVK